MRRVLIDAQPYSMAENFSELTQEQQIMISAAMLSSSNYNDVCTKIALSLVSLTVMNKEPLVYIDGKYKKYSDVDNVGSAPVFYYFLHKSKYVHLLTNTDVVPLVDATDSLFKVDKKNNRVEIILDSAEPIERIITRGRSLKGYERGLTDFTLNDFIDCETAIADFYDGDEFSLYRFIARAYGRRMRELTDAKLSARATAIMKSVSPAVANAIRLNYEGQKVFLHRKFSKLFGGGADSGTSANTVFDDYCKLVATLGGGDPTKHRDIKNTLLYEALYALQERINTIEITTAHARPIF